jgi:uncharacterized damage-inducible protein DinB
MTTTAGFPSASPDEIEMLLRWLAFLRGAVLRKASGIDDEQARWQPDGKLIPLIGIVNHLTGVEARWIDGEMRGEQVGKPADEYAPPPTLTIDKAIQMYERRAAATDSFVRELGDVTARSRGGDSDLRFILLHLINETARHAGHADAVRELLDGTVGE